MKDECLKSLPSVRHPSVFGEEFRHAPKSSWHIGARPVRRSTSSAWMTVQPYTSFSRELAPDDQQSLWPTTRELFGQRT